jgi:hypothetical protein
MNALVNRGSPRYLRDIYEVCRRGLLSASQCWQLYGAKNPGLSADDASAKVLHAFGATGNPAAAGQHSRRRPAPRGGCGAELVLRRVLSSADMTEGPEIMPLDHSAYPELARPPDTLPTPETQMDYMHQFCAAFDFEIFPGREDWERFASWRQIFDAYPLPDSPAYHTFRARFGWPPVSRGTCGLVPPRRVQDLREGRADPCADSV